MAKKKQLIIPIFIPFAGCTHQCVFCNQEHITNTQGLPSLCEVVDTIESYLVTWERGKGTGPKEVAFYGGSFTGLDIKTQKDYLDAVAPFARDGHIDGVRLSTRPDYIDDDICEFLKTNHVKTVELGVESLDENVLRLSARGHSGEDVAHAVKVLRSFGFKVGLQMMPGLPGDTKDTIIKTAEGIRDLCPDFVRVYPTLVVKDTPLEKMYLRGDYKPWSLDDMVEVSAEVSKIFTEAHIKIIKFGLQPTPELEATILAGPYHRSFRNLVDAYIQDNP